MRELRLSLLALLLAVAAFARGPEAPPALSAPAAAVTAGNDHTCAKTTPGGLKCWGANFVGQVGDGTTANSPVPVDVSGLASGAAGVGAGGDHSCGVTATGAAKCWGENSSGELGNGSMTDSTTPVAVSGLGSGVAAVAAGGQHTCALLTTGGVKCWGNNFWGQLGNGSTTNSTTPVNVSALSSGVSAIAAGAGHTCALLMIGTVKCWGANYSGQLGDGTIIFRTSPVTVAGLSDVSDVTVGEAHTCAVVMGGGVKCWGYNAYGQLGVGTTSDSPSPLDVPGLSAVDVAAGQYHTCAATTAGGVKCWGYNAYGQLGDASTTQRTSPVNVATLGSGSGVAAVAAGRAHSCARMANGPLKCWGNNTSGQLGNDGSGISTTPVAVLGFGPDNDGDGIEDVEDNCPAVANPGQENSVHPGTAAGDHCEDFDLDGVVDFFDNCPDTVNPLQENAAHPATPAGDRCEDFDGDGLLDIDDNCPDDANAGQEDMDGDGRGDVCDPDVDGDLVNGADEVACGSDPLDGGSRPERLDGAFAGVDEDGDDPGDGSGIDEALPPGSETSDCDGDGFSGEAEAHIFAGAGALDQDPCGADGWSLDLHPGDQLLPSQNRVTAQDYASFLAPIRYLDQNLGDTPGNVRWDLIPGPGALGSDINAQDLNAMLGGDTANPPMLQGLRALDGPDCPWPP